MLDKQRLLDYLKAEIKKRNEYFEPMDMFDFATGEETALIRLLSAIEGGKFDKEEQHGTDV